MTYASSARQPEPEPRSTWARSAECPVGGRGSSVASGAVNGSNVVSVTAAHTARQGASRHDDASLPSPETPTKGKKSRSVVSIPW